MFKIAKRNGNPLAILISGLLLFSVTLANAQSVWMGYGGNAQHTAQSTVASQPLTKILWQASMDDAPPYSGNSLLIHYGAPAITPNGTVIYPVRHSNNTFSIVARNINTGVIIWTANSTYSFPSGYNWIPSFGVTLIQLPSLSTNHINYAVCWPESGGRIAIRPYPDQPNRLYKIQAFYGDHSYNLNSSAYDAHVHICTPLTAGTNGTLYFGFQVDSAVPNNMQSGIGLMHLNGTGTWVGAAAASSDSAITQPQFNCAPALSLDNQSVYIGVAVSGWSRGYLLDLDGQTLATKGIVQPMDPYANSPASILSDSTASPMVGPDGTVFYGVFETSCCSDHDRGYMMHYSADLTQQFTPSSFGWDLTDSVVPSTMVPSYTGTSSYLLMSKYNNYAETGGDGVNKVAILDPTTTETDPYNGATVMGEVATLTGPTADAYYRANGYPNAVREWCINSAAIDIPGHAVIANCEDGNLYKWDLDTLSISQEINLTPGIGEAYTPTEIAPGGQVLAINNATLFCVGGPPSKPVVIIKKSPIGTSRIRP